MGDEDTQTAGQLPCRRDAERVRGVLAASTRVVILEIRNGAVLRSGTGYSSWGSSYIVGGAHAAVVDAARPDALAGTRPVAVVSGERLR